MFKEACSFSVEDKHSLIRQINESDANVRSSKNVELYPQRRDNASGDFIVLPKNMRSFFFMEYLEARHLNIVSWEDDPLSFNPSSYYVHLKIVDLKHNRMDNSGFKNLCKLPAIRQLRLADNNISEICDEVAALRNIELLSLTGNPVTIISAHIHACGNLKDFRIDTKNLGPFYGEIITRSKSFLGWIDCDYMKTVFRTLLKVMVTQGDEPTFSWAKLASFAEYMLSDLPLSKASPGGSDGLISMFFGTLITPSSETTSETVFFERFYTGWLKSPIALEFYQNTLIQFYDLMKWRKIPRIEMIANQQNISGESFSAKVSCVESTNSSVIPWERKVDCAKFSLRYWRDSTGPVVVKVTAGNLNTFKVFDNLKLGSGSGNQNASHDLPARRVSLIDSGGIVVGGGARGPVRKHSHILVHPGPPREPETVHDPMCARSASPVTQGRFQRVNDSSSGPARRESTIGEPMKSMEELGIDYAAIKPLSWRPHPIIRQEDSGRVIKFFKNQPIHEKEIHFAKLFSDKRCSPNFFGWCLNSDNLLFMVTELYGLDLGHLPETETDLKELFFDVHNAISTIHSQRVWHRDIKLQNFTCLRDEENRIKVKVIDFGSCKAEDPPGMITRMNSRDAVTAALLHPKMSEGWHEFKPASKFHDWYQFGIMVALLLRKNILGELTIAAKNSPRDNFDLGRRTNVEMHEAGLPGWAKLLDFCFPADVNFPCGCKINELLNGVENKERLMAVRAERVPVGGTPPVTRNSSTTAAHDDA